MLNKMTERRTKNVLPIKEKLDLIEKMEKGKRVADLAVEYCVGIQTVRDIKKNKRKLEEFAQGYVNSVNLSKRRSMKKSPYEELDFTLLQWFNQKRAEGVPVSGPMCIKKAKMFHETLGLEGTFSASSGWLTRFKQRYGIRLQNGSLEQIDQHIDNADMGCYEKPAISYNNTQPIDKKENEEELKEHENEWVDNKDIVKRVDHNTAIHCANILLQYMNQWDFKRNDITAVKKIRCDIFSIFQDSFDNK